MFTVVVTFSISDELTNYVLELFDNKTWRESYEIQIKKEPEQAAIQCNTCDSIFKTVGLLRRHMRCEHSSVITSNQ